MYGKKSSETIKSLEIFKYENIKEQYQCENICINNWYDYW